MIYKILSVGEIYEPRNFFHKENIAKTCGWITRNDRLQLVNSLEECDFVYYYGITDPGIDHDVREICKINKPVIFFLETDVPMPPSNESGRKDIYFTVVKNNTPNVPLPLQYYIPYRSHTDYLPEYVQNHKLTYDERFGSKTILASFVGTLTGRRYLLDKTIKLFSDIYYEPFNGNWWSCKDPEIKRVKKETYCTKMSESIFTLCPRGYGPSSQRLYDAMMLGSIPVLICDSSEPLDESLDFLLKSDQMHDLEPLVIEMRRIANDQNELFKMRSMIDKFIKEKLFVDLFTDQKLMDRYIDGLNSTPIQEIIYYGSFVVDVIDQYMTDQYD